MQRIDMRKYKEIKVIKMETLESLPKCLIPESEYRLQKAMSEVILQNWRASVEYEVANGNQAPNVMGYFPEAQYLANSAKWCKEPFGAANDMQHSACIVFVAKQLLDFYQVEVGMLDLKNMVVKKGYRAWKFKGSDKTFFTPEATLKEALKALPPEVDQTQIRSIQDAEAFIGKPQGIGGMHILLDNIIAKYACCGRVCDTRFRFVNEVYQALRQGQMVPMRVTNTIYHGDSSREGGHFVILVKIENQIATVIDSSVGERTIPIHQLLQASDVAWNVRTRKKPSHNLRAPYNY